MFCGIHAAMGIVNLYLKSETKKYKHPGKQKNSRDFWNPAIDILEKNRT